MKLFILISSLVVTFVVHSDGAPFLPGVPGLEGLPLHSLPGLGGGGEQKGSSSGIKPVGPNAYSGFPSQLDSRTQVYDKDTNAYNVQQQYTARGNRQDYDVAALNILALQKLMHKLPL